MSTELTIQRKQNGGAILPENIDQTWRLATAICKAGMAPRSLDSTEKVMVAMLHGMELGMTPMAAVQSIAVINGTPSLYGDGLLGVVRASGLLEYCKEWTEETDGVLTAFCEVKRKGEPEPVRRSFSAADAKKAGLWDERERVKRKRRNGEWYDAANDAPWFKYPARMLQMRARSWALRDTFADALKGVHCAEEVMDRSEPRDVTPEPPKPPKSVEPPPPPPEEPETDSDAMTTDELVEHIDACLAVAADIETLDETWEDRMAALGEEMGDEASRLARGLYEKHCDRINRTSEEPGLPLEDQVVNA